MRRAGFGRCLLGRHATGREPLAGQLEAPNRGDHADPLVGTLGVVVGDPGVQGGLRLLRLAKTLPGEQFGAQRLVEALDLAGGRRAARRGEQVADAVLAAEAVEEHQARATPEARREHLAVVGEDLLGGAVARMAARNASQTGLAVARGVRWAQTQKRQWSSMPVTISRSRPPSSFTPPITSICQSSIARRRSQRR